MPEEKNVFEEIALNTGQENALETAQFYKYSFPSYAEKHFAWDMFCNGYTDLRMAVRIIDSQKQLEARYYDFVSGVPLVLKGQEREVGVIINSSVGQILRITPNSQQMQDFQKLLSSASEQQIQKYRNFMRRKLQVEEEKRKIAEEENQAKQKDMTLSLENK